MDATVAHRLDVLTGVIASLADTFRRLFERIREVAHALIRLVAPFARAYLRARRAQWVRPASLVIDGRAYHRRLLARR
jgi:hypothetical protein